MVPRNTWSKGFLTRYVQLIVKRGFDIAASAIALLVLAPLFLLTALGIAFESITSGIFRTFRIDGFFIH